MKFLGRNSIRAVFSGILIFTLILCSANFGNYTVYGYEEKAGVIVGGEPYVKTRVTASDDAERVNTLENGKEVTVIGETTGDDGLLWYQVKYILKANGEERTGYCRALNVSLIDEVDETSKYAGDAVVIAIGIINATNVYVRNEPGTSGTYKLTALNNGHTVDVIGSTTVSGAVWYQVNCTNDGVNYTGWVYGQYLNLTYTNVETDEEFAQSLRDAGFPESYITNLSALHALYPNWTFLPIHTGLEWSNVITAESRAAVNMVQTSADDAKKSVASSEYNWNTNTWVIRDGSGWVTAHPDYIAYCMDPRNYLTETSIFQFESLSFNSAQNKAGVEAIIKSTFMINDVLDTDGTTLNYPTAFVSIGQATGVSPYHLASRVVQEQGQGTSPLISGTYSGYEGYFNYFNVNAFGTPVSVLYENGLSYAKNKGWNTRYKSILGGAELLSQNYIARGQDTLYFQKFNVVYASQLYGHQYMANVTAAITEGQKIAKAYTDKTQSFVFRIPVYLNMPEEAVTFTASGNRNNYLSNISVSGLSLTPTFTGDTTDYSLVVDYGVKSITVAATPVTSKSSVTGTGTYKLEVGDNIIKINCKSQSGDTRTYTLTVARKSDIVPDGYITSFKYNIGDYITGVDINTTAEDFLNNITFEDGTMEVLDANGEVNTGNIATGNKLAIYKDGTLVSTKDIVVYGDVNGDGAVDVLDIIKINRHILGLEQLSDASLQAGDANRKNDGVDVLDLIVINRHTLGLTTIQQ